MAPSQEKSPGRTAHGVGIGLREAYASASQPVHRGSIKVFGAVAVCVQSALVVGEEYHDVGSGGKQGTAKGEKGGKNESLHGITGLWAFAAQRGALRPLDLNSSSLVLSERAISGFSATRLFRSPGSLARL